MKKIFSILVIIISLFVPVSGLFAQTPGTYSDPLVTKSYLDFAARFRRVEVKSGTKVTTESGAFIVVLSGQFKVELKKGGMIVNLTNGRKMSSNGNLQAFNLYMIPDGSLCSFKAAKDSCLMAIGLNDEGD